MCNTSDRAQDQTSRGAASARLEERWGKDAPNVKKVTVPARNSVHRDDLRSPISKYRPICGAIPWSAQSKNRSHRKCVRVCSLSAASTGSGKQAFRG